MCTSRKKKRQNKNLYKKFHVYSFARFKILKKQNTKIKHQNKTPKEFKAQNE